MRIVQTWDNTGSMLGGIEGVESHCPFFWSAFEPRPGVYDFALVERSILAALEAQIGELQVAQVELRSTQQGLSRGLQALRKATADTAEMICRVLKREGV